MSNKLKLKVRTKLPAALIGRTGIAVAKDGLTYNLDLDYSGLAQTSQFDPINDLFAVWNKATGVWNTVNPASFVAGSFYSAIAASQTVSDGVSLVAIQRTSPSSTSLTLPSLANQGGRAIVILDWSTSVTSHAITITPAGGVGTTIMKAANWTINSSASQAAAVVLYPSLDLNSWYIAPLSNFLQTGTGAVPRTFQDKARESVSAKDFGAVGDGVTDDTAAINAALAAKDVVRLPPGNYLVSGQITMNRQFNYLIGSGVAATFVTRTTASGIAILIGATPQYWGVQDLTLDRNVTATAGGYGIQAPNLTNYARISNVTVQRQHIGLDLGSCVYGFVENVISQLNVSVGVHMINGAAVGGMQWQLDHVLSQVNGSHGFFVESVAAASGAATLGDWNNISAGFNGGFGAAFVASASNPISNIRVNQMFMGQDGLGELYIDTHDTGAATHIFRGLTLELAGTTATGPGLAIAATNSADGITITAANNSVIIDGFWIHAMSYSGIVSSAGLLQLSNGVVLNNGGAVVAGRRNGISHSGTGSLFMTNVKSGNTAGASQQFGLTLDPSTTGNYIFGNDFTVGTGNASAAISNASTAVTNVIKDNRGYNPVGQSAITVGASPFTYRAGPTLENVYIQGGTVIGINVGATSAAPTSTSIVLGPNQTLTVAYSSAPIMSTNKM